MSGMGSFHLCHNMGLKKSSMVSDQISIGSETKKIVPIKKLSSNLQVPGL